MARLTRSRRGGRCSTNTAVGGALSLPASADAPATIASTDAEAAELYALLEAERDAAKAEVQRLTGELGNLRADRERLTKERDAAVGRANRLQVEAEQARLGESESRERIRVLESELAAARQQNERLIKERDAAREALARRPDGDEYESLCEELAEERKERQRLAEALETKQTHITELQAALADSSRVDREDFEVIATSLRTLVATKVMSAEEAFEKLVEAVK
jgi:chemotaxis protein MotB